jgi:hypothetical protein
VLADSQLGKDRLELELKVQAMLNQLAASGQVSDEVIEAALGPLAGIKKP